MVDTIIQWLTGLFKTIPEDIVKGLIVSFCMLLIKQLVSKVRFLNSKVKSIIEKLVSTNIEISLETSFIDSPDYPYISKRRTESVEKRNLNDNDAWGIIIALVIVPSIIIIFFKEYVEYISLFLKWIGIIPLILSIIFLFIIFFSKEVQKVTVKFIIVSVVVSVLTLYYGFIIKDMALTMTGSMTDTRNWGMSLYKVLGVLIGGVQQTIPYMLLLRVLSVYIDRKKKKPIESVRKFIARTKYIESKGFLIGTILMLSIVSYLLTHDAFLELILNK